jgi:hypothetical protein
VENLPVNKTVGRKNTMKTQTTYMKLTIAPLLVLCVALFLGCEDEQNDQSENQTTTSDSQVDTSSVAEAEDTQEDTSFAARLNSADRVEYFKGTMVTEFVHSFNPGENPPGPTVYYTQTTYTGNSARQIIAIINSSSPYSPDPVDDIDYDDLVEDRMEFYSGSSLLGTIIVLNDNLFEYDGKLYQNDGNIVL